MGLSELREQLLEQHRQLRETVQEAQSLCSAILEGRSNCMNRLHAVLLQLERSLEQHNKYEESVLRDVLPDLDAWGPIRSERMDERHVSEHGALVRTLEDLTRIDDEVRCAKMTTVTLDEILSHMNNEEKELYDPRVMTDDVVSIEFGG